MRQTKIEADEAKCSFCGRPRRLALCVVTGPAGIIICDLCVLEARSRANPIEIGSLSARCSFCGRSPDEAPLILARNEAGICPDCAQNCRKVIESVMPGESEFLTDIPQIDSKQKIEEIRLLTLEFEENLRLFRKSFEADDVDWNVYNLLAQAIIPLKSKAALMKLGKVSDLMWEIETAFRSIRGDDKEANRPGIEKLAAFMCKLMAEVEKIYR